MNIIADAGSFTKEEILNPDGWILLSFLMDSRTGLGYFKDYRISNYQLMLDLIQYCRTMSSEEILKQPDVKQRVDRYFEHQDLFKRMLEQTSYTKKHLVITSLLNEETTYVGNRFMVYALYPEQNIDLRVMWGKDKQNVVVACGHSILNRSSRTSVGSLMSKYGDGGHTMAGTCQVPIDKRDEILEEIIDVILKDG